MPTNTIEYKNDGIYYNGSKVGAWEVTQNNQSTNYIVETTVLDGKTRVHNNGASGEITYTLPPATAGYRTTVINSTEHNLKVEVTNASDDKIFTPKYKYGIDYVDIKPHNSSDFYCVNSTDWHTDKGLSTLWGQAEKLVASDVGVNDYFGDSVAISGDYAIVGAFNEGEGGAAAGAAYIFHKDWGGINNWGEVTKIMASDAQAGDNFGCSVAISGDYAIVGVYGEDTGGSNAGAAYIFHKDQGGVGSWGQVTKIMASDTQASDCFGYSVAISGDYTIVGAYQEDEKASNAGAAYIFHKDQGGVGSWGQVTKIMASDAQADDYFGNSVAISGDYAIVGANLEDTGGLSGAGSAYIFDQQ